MRDRLLQYYENELRFIRRQLVDFAESYPAVAGQLLLEPDKCEDPHVERLIESFAMLTARVQLRLDDDFPEITTALLDMLQPNFLAPIAVGDGGPVHRRRRPLPGHHGHADPPPQPDPHAAGRGRALPLPHLLSGDSVADRGHGGGRSSALDRGSALCPPEAVAAIRIELRTLGAQTFAQLPLENAALLLRRRRHDGQPFVRTALPASAGACCVRPGRRDTEASRVGGGASFLPPTALHQVGFAADEGLLERPRTAHLGHRLLQEYFVFPDKFLFGEISGLTPQVLAAGGQGAGDPGAAGPAAAGTGGQAGSRQPEAGLHAGGEPVPAPGRARHPAQDRARIPDRARRPRPARLRGALGRAGRDPGRAHRPGARVPAVLRPAPRRPARGRAGLLACRPGAPPVPGTTPAPRSI